MSTRHSQNEDRLPGDFLRVIRERWSHLRSDAEDEPVFVLASGWRSGSTMLQRMLMKNCFVWGEPYGHAGLLPSLLAPLRCLDREWPRDDVFFAGELQPEQLSKKFIANLFPSPERLLASHLEFFRTFFAPPPSCSVRRWGVKEVRLGVDYASYFRWLFPRAKFLFLVRDPYDCYRSYAAVNGVWYRWWPYDPIDTPQKFAEHWLRLTQGFLADHQRLGGMLVRYEDLTGADFDPRRVNEYLGFELDMEARESVVGASIGKVVEPEGLAEFHAVVAELAGELGYSPPAGICSPATAVQKTPAIPIEQQFHQLDSFGEALSQRTHALESLRNALAAKEEANAASRQQLARKDEELDQLRTELSDFVQRSDDQDQRIALCQSRLHTLEAEKAIWDNYRNSREWALLEAARRLRSLLLPSQSRREAAARKVFRLLRGLYRQMHRTGSWIHGQAVRPAMNALSDGTQALRRISYRGLRSAFHRLPPALRYRIKAAVFGMLYPRAAVRRAAVNASSPHASGLVSVVLPVYNHARLLRDSIESVLAQTYRNFELIIIDDGSTDGVENVLAEYVNRPQIRILCQRNQKLPRALSNGFRLARGEFWTWTSADNLMQPEQLQRQVAFLRANPGTAMVYADYLAIDDRGQPLSDPSYRPHNRRHPTDPVIHPPRTADQLAKARDNFIGPCFMYRGWVGTLLGDYDDVLGVEDYDYWMRVYLSFRIAHLGTDEPLYQYRVHDNSLTANAGSLGIFGRAEELFRYQARRQRYYDKPWTIYVDDATWEKIGGACGGPDRLVRWSDPSSLPSLASDKNMFLVQAASLPAVAALGLPRSIPVEAWFSGESAESYRFRGEVHRANATCFAREESTRDRLRLLHAPTIQFGSWADLTAIAAAHANQHAFRLATRSEEHGAISLPEVFRLAHSRLCVLLQVDGLTHRGTEQTVIELAVSLDPARFCVTVLALGDVEASVAMAAEHGIRVLTLPSTAPEIAYRQLLLDEEINLVNAHSSVFGAAIAAELGLPFVQTIHSAHLVLTPPQQEAYAANDPFTSAYICASAEAAQCADVKFGLSVNKIVVVPNQVAPAFGHHEMLDREAICRACTYLFPWLVQGGAPSEARCWIDSPPTAPGVPAAIPRAA
jgi:glycosyltransferase involved in cell wall biosynthesis